MVITKSSSSGITWLRALSMISIVICHLAQFYQNNMSQVFNVGVQIFIIISGFLYGCKTIENWGGYFKKRLQKVYLPYLLFIIPILVLYAIFHKEVLYLAGVISYILGLQGFFSIGGLGYLWFVTAIFICYLITPLLQRFRVFKYPILLVIAAVLIQLIDIYCFNLKLMYVPLFILGYFWANLRIIDFNIIGLLAALALVFIPSLLYPIVLSDIKETTALSGILHCLGGITALYLVIILFDYFNIKKTPSVIKQLSDHSYYIYLVHGVLILGPFGLITLTSNIIINVMFVLFLIMLTSFILRGVDNSCQKIISVLRNG